ncbi:SIR2 family protein [Cupriavidus taiwanensis]|nr:SIR2 family protein [Cupriavidus taiwanensis]
MSFELLSKEDLLIAAVATKRPVAFLVGSPLSVKDGVGVPGVTEILDIIRDEIRGRAAFSLPNFDTALSGKVGGDAYQEGMKWLGKKMGQDAINDVIKTAILKARKAGIAEPLPGMDGHPEEWNIPAGTLSLGEMVAGGNERFLGPVLTTNFDPLISLAVRSAGGRSGRRVLAADGTLAGQAEDEPGICSIVHLHGFWRDSDTLHTQAQLTNPRPKLTKSLQRLLQRRTLIVAAYGGWDDVFTRALIEQER